MYAWSIRSLAGRMQYFGIRFTDNEVKVNDMEDVVKKDISGPGEPLGNRAVHKNQLQEVHGLNVSQWCRGSQATTQR